MGAIKSAKDAIAMHTKYCQNNNLPIFIPHDGRCYRCYRNIFETGGYTDVKSVKTHITHCPFCHKSFCD